jgi:multiple sugar transport system permease protein
VKALDFYTTLCSRPWRDSAGRRHYGYAARETEERRKWDMGKIGFLFAYCGDKFLEKINPDVTGIVAVPLGPGGKRGAEINSRMMGIFSKIKDIPVRDAAWEYMRYLDSREAVAIRTAKMVEGGMGRFVDPACLREFGYDDIIDLLPKGWEETFKIAIETGRPEPYGKNSQTVYYYMTDPLRKADAMERRGEFPADREKRLAAMKKLLVDAVRITNSKMLGEVPEKEMRFRRLVAFCALVIIVLAFGYAVWFIVRAFSPPDASGMKTARWGFVKYKWAYMTLAPALFLIAMWQYLPLALGARMAFLDYQLVNPSRWIGVDNFANILWEPQWWNAIWNSLCYSFLVVSLTFLPPVVLAVLLDEIPYGKILYRTMFYLPAVITGLVVIYLWKSFYSKEHSGVLNSVVLSIPAIGYLLLGAALFALFLVFARRLWLQQAVGYSIFCVIVGAALFLFCASFAHNIFVNCGKPWYEALFMRNLDPYDWLGDEKTALLSCVLPMVWAGMGPGCLIYLAALKGISPDFYEAADIDGATFVDKILFIVIPSLKALLIINFVGVFVNSWKNSAYILAMTGLDPKTKVAGLKIFEDAYMLLRFGPATAEAWMLGFLLIGFTMHQLRILSKLEFKAAGASEK